MNLSAGSAVYTIPLTGLPAGTYPLLATYNGDGSDAASLSAVVALKVQ